jgi:glucosamine-6-phosphate deaminase
MTGGRKPPKIVVCRDADAASGKVAEIIADAIRSQPKTVLGLATGGTPVGTYRELVRMHREDGLDFSHVTSFNLDEYIGLGPDHPQSFRHFMQQHLFDHVNITQTHVPDGLATDLALHARAYEENIRLAGGIDLQILGIGSNGHIAFNEPGSAADSRTRAIDLTPDTINANSRFFDSIDEVPRHAITMGIGTILEAKEIVLMAMGQGKADAVKRAIEDDPDVSHPASWLQHHDQVTFVLDRDAARQLASRQST